MFRGMFGFVRNRAHHQIDASIGRLRTLQIIGFIDYLLSLLSEPRPKVGAAKANSDIEQ
jgi:hypothetical protein